MNYIHITYDAVLEFTSGRNYQSAEFETGASLCQILKGLPPSNWPTGKILMKEFRDGIVFFTDKIERKKGVCFDLNTFDVKKVADDTIITIFQKTLKYAVKYFENLPLSSSEKQIPNTSITLVFPYPFTASRDVDKIHIDRNSSKLARKDANYLTVYYLGNRDDISVSYNNLQRAYDDIKNINETDLHPEIPFDGNMPLDVVELDLPELTIDAPIGHEQWMRYLTKKQKDFVISPLTGPERLEGAAGTGKTLSMVLRCIHILTEKEKIGEDFHIIFVTHSVATKDKIINVFRMNWPNFDMHMEKNENTPTISILVTTLQEWSAAHLGTNSIYESQYIDRDAAYSKGIQMMYIEQSYDLMRSEKEWNGYSPILSERLKKYLQNTPKENLLELLQREVAITIKGRAKEDIDNYKAIHRSKYSIPVENDADLNFLFQIFKNYQDALIKTGQYDSDDIVLSAIGQIDTPIWKRRRIKEGYDACFIDETHLFNLNELSLFHFINKPDRVNHIIFAIDKSQAVGEWAVDEDELKHLFGTNGHEEKEKLMTVFRCSRDITHLAFDILASGVPLFTSFENPLEHTNNNFTREEENKCEPPQYVMSVNDAQMIENAFDWIDNYVRKKHTHKACVLMTCTNDELLAAVKKYADSTNRHYESLESRGDDKAIRRAKDAHKYLFGGIDLVGGLEFDAVAIVGVDASRVPPAKKDCDAYHYMRYAWHNRMYVAITRAKYAICMFGVKSYGPSVVVENALGNNYLEYIQV